mmetsp:Transcript_7162/g.11331  ORF Transcript_7162/g.11331 Transcript_7162/m.11331 type:complete len:565 (+) Transcript_7162:126-1820(+)
MVTNTNKQQSSARVLVDFVKYSSQNETNLVGYLAAPSPAVRPISPSTSLKTDPRHPLEAVGPEIIFRLCRFNTANYGPLKHSLYKGALFEFRCQDSIIPPSQEDHVNLVLEASLVRCSGDGKHVFKLLHLLAPDSHFPPPPLTYDPYVALGLSSRQELQHAHELWRLEGKQDAMSNDRIQKQGERHSETLLRKPKLRKWINSTAISLRPKSMSKASSRHPTVKKSHMIIAGTALRMFYSRKIGPVELIPLSHPKEEKLDVLVQLPSGLGEKTENRRQAWADRKKPQLQWMLQQIDELIALSGKESNAKIVVLDVGGGRGDLAIWLGMQRPRVKTVAIDVHPPSVKGGQVAIECAGVNHLANSVLCDASDLISKDDDVRKKANTLIGNFDLLVGLHCCGGLSEIAMIVALEYNVPFCICTCCFCSHPDLCRLLPAEGEEWKSLSALSEVELARQSKNLQKVTHIEKYKETRKNLLRACEREGARATDDARNGGFLASEGRWEEILPVGASPQTSAMAAVNIMRLDAFSRLADTKGRQYETKILSFDATLSTRNLVVVGTPTMENG